MTEYARRSIVDRMKGAAMLDVATYEEVEHAVERFHIERLYIKSVFI